MTLIAPGICNMTLAPKDWRKSWLWWSAWGQLETFGKTLAYQSGPVKREEFLDKDNGPPHAPHESPRLVSGTRLSFFWSFFSLLPRWGKSFVSIRSLGLCK